MPMNNLEVILFIWFQQRIHNLLEPTTILWYRFND